MKKTLLILIPLIIVAAILYYLAFMRAGMPDPRDNGGVTEVPSFNPLNPGPGAEGGGISTTPPGTGISEQPFTTPDAELPRLRQLSATPIGGFVASSTASTTLVRFVDRGVGHVYEAPSDTSLISKISNTTIPRVYESYWHKKGGSAILRYMKDEEGTIVNFSAELRPVRQNASSTDVQLPFEIKGKFISPNILGIATSPKGDRIFTLNRESGKTIGYISGFDESKKTEVISLPLTDVTLEWPEENTVAISTKASALSSGYVYLVDLKKPTLKKILGNITGLTAKVSPDAKKVLYTSTGSRGFITSLLNITDNSTQEVVFKTLVEKCVWSKLNPTEAYCAVPTETPRGIYPDDWYKGNVSFIDQIWHLDTVTGEVQLVANLLTMGNQLIDVINPVLDPKENFLYFMNKRDLTLWSLDLNE